MNTLSTTELERYSRQLILNDWSETKQLSLKNSAVLFLGFTEKDNFLNSCGLYLVASGVGAILFDKEIENLESLLKDFQKQNHVSVGFLGNNDFSNGVIIAKNKTSLENLISNKFFKNGSPASIVWEPEKSQISFSSQANIARTPQPAFIYETTDMLEAGTLTALLTMKHLGGF